MPRLLSLVVVLVALPTAYAEPRYFPPHTFNDYAGQDKFVSDWYSAQLSALSEPSLFERSHASPEAVSYRFLWLRSFHHPVAVRLDVQPDGTSILFVKIASGAGGHAPGKLTTETSKPLSSAATRRVLDRIAGTGFWTLPTEVKMKNGGVGADGAEWIIEGVDHGRYHLSEQWSEPDDGAIRGLGMFFLFDLAGLQVPKDEIY